MPSGQEVQPIQKKFYAIAGFPNVVGAIDGTQIRIQCASQNEDDFVNRKGYHSINVQMICDPTFKILDVVTKWPRSVHDSRVFRESDICNRYEICEVDGLLLGDSGYACKKYLLTPFPNPATPAQERFNASLCKTRVLIEQSFGILKRRFPCLSYELRLTPSQCVKIVGTCVILHNIGINRNDMFARACEDRQQPEVDMYLGPESGNHYRDFIVMSFFS